MMDQVIRLLALIFVVTSMSSMGLGLTFAQIRSSLVGIRLVTIALILNFVISPLLALLLARAFRLDDDIAAGLILLGAAAGAPVLPRLVYLARGDVVESVGLMVLLNFLTILYMPPILPILLPDAEILFPAVLRSFLFMLLLPILLGMMIRANCGREATFHLRYTCAQVANFALILMLTLGLAVHFHPILDLVGNGGIIAGTCFTVTIAAAGYAMGNRMISLASGQRNAAAAVLVAAQCCGSETVTFVLTLSLLSLGLLMTFAIRLGKNRILPGN